MRVGFRTKRTTIKSIYYVNRRVITGIVGRYGKELSKAANKLIDDLDTAIYRFFSDTGLPGDPCSRSWPLSKACGSVFIDLALVAISLKPRIWSRRIPCGRHA